MSGAPEADPGDPIRQLATVIGLAFAVTMHLVVGLFTVSVGLIAPLWAILVLNAIWLGLGYAIWRLRHRPLLALLVPFAHAAILYATLTFGELVLGWTA